MDPLTAIGLAGNIVQFVDFSCKLISETREVYKSASGLPRHAMALDTAVKDIEKMMDGLQISSSRGTAATGSLLRSLAFDCTAVAEDLRSAIEKLKSDSKDKLWKSFTTALKLTLRPNEVRRITDGIVQLQKKVGLQLLTLMTQQQYEMTVKLGEIEDNDRRLGWDQTIHFHQLKDDLLRAINCLQTNQNLRESNIESHLNKISRLQDCAQADVAALSQRMDKLQNTLKAFACETRDIAVEQAVMDSLAYREAYIRRDQVAVGHLSTFSWIFDEQFTAGPNNNLTFSQWLQSDQGMCWIAGKPGSGKSTLMKRILMEDRTHADLLEWANKTQHGLCVGSYFFWIAGTPLQKSQEGLLRSLLYDVFQQVPQSIHKACSNTRLESSNPYRSNRASWTRAELFETLVTLAERKDINKKYCFFIDGLDEYKVPDEGNFDDLVLLLKHLSACSNFKFVIASREENEFRDHYLNVNHYILQRLTVKDIETLVHSLFDENSHFQRLSKEDPAYIQLEEEIVRRAQGVFLWVTLVVKTLLNGMRNADTIADLRRELDSLPDSLEIYFKRIIDSIEPRYRIPAAKSLQVTNQAIRPLHLLTHYFLDDTPHKAKAGIWQPLSDSEIERYHEDARRRLNARCRGLLDIVENEQQLRSSYFRYSVHYLHRTIRDFLYETTEMQAFLERLLPPGYIAQQELCKAFLHLMSNIPLCDCGCDLKFSPETRHPGNRPFEAVLRSFLDHAKYMWQIRNDPQIELLREAERIVFSRPRQWRKAKPTAFVGLAVQYGLVEYVKIRVEECPKLLREKSRPLLDYAVHSATSSDFTELAEDGLSTFDFVKLQSHRTEPGVRVEMVSLLLQLGATVEHRVWSPLIASVHHQNTAHLSEQDLVAILAKFVEYGADLDEEHTIGFRIVRARETGRGGDLFRKEQRIDQTKRAKDILKAEFTTEQFETILRRRPLRRKTKFPWSLLSKYLAHNA